MSFEIWRTLNVKWHLLAVMLNLFHCCPVNDLPKSFTGQPVLKRLRYFALKRIQNAIRQP
jgi:hypothetical protein